MRQHDKAAWSHSFTLSADDLPWQEVNRLQCKVSRVMHMKKVDQRLNGAKKRIFIFLFYICLFLLFLWEVSSHTLMSRDIDSTITMVCQEKSVSRSQTYGIPIRFLQTEVFLFSSFSGYNECNATIWHWVTAEIQISYQHDGIDGARSMSVEALEADLYEQSVQMKRWKLDRIKHCCITLFKKKWCKG